MLVFTSEVRTVSSAITDGATIAIARLTPNSILKVLITDLTILKTIPN